MPLFTDRFLLGKVRGNGLSIADVLVSVCVKVYVCQRERIKREILDSEGKGA